MRKELTKRLLICAAVVAGAVISGPTQLRAQDGLPPPADRAVKFADDIRPIFESRCLECHGPRKQKGGLRLDRRETALKGGDSGAAIRPGASADSLLIHAVAGLGDATPMPPKGDRLTPEQIGLLRAWIDQGAAWPDEAAELAPAPDAEGAPQHDPRLDHWSFKPPTRPEPPVVRNGAWLRNPFDNFILARLEAEGLNPSPEADLVTLARRLSLDLIGLPPTLEEVDRFTADASPDAYEKLVDRLLASPHFGERWGRKWLDLARYADTNGYEKDRDRSIWPYRDWVINAFNRNMPFDQFAIEQVAGDMLPGATLEQKIATGFFRNSMLNEEGGIDVEEDRFKSMVDRMEVTGAAFLGLTIQCAQCHDHKYDPVTQREYYQLFALLNSADEPTMDIPTPDWAGARRKAEARLARLEADLESHFPAPPPDKNPWAALPEVEQRRRHLEQKFEAWESAASAKAIDWTPLRPASINSEGRATMTLLDDASVLVSGDKPNRDTYIFEADAGPGSVTGLRLEALTHLTLPGGGPGRGDVMSVGGFMLTDIRIEWRPTQTAADAAWTPIELHNATADFSAKKKTPDMTLDGVTDTGWAIDGGERRERRMAVEFKTPVQNASGARLRVTLEQRYIHQTTLGRFRVSVTNHTPTAEAPIRASDMTAAVETALGVPARQRSPESQALIRRHFLMITPELAQWSAEITQARLALPAPPTTLVLEERETPRVTRLHPRGEFLREGPEVAPGVPSWLHALPDGAPPNRLALARWLVDTRNPLVGRVVMNRFWQEIFGRGLVATPDDFGLRCEPPSHPELLDWLATEFMARGWDVKAMLRLIVTSAAYRQGSAITPEMRERDPNNVLLARAPRVRLDAELVRDAALASSGLLSAKIGGPSVKPPQPPGVTELAYGSPKYVPSVGEDRYRRGLYTYLKRTAPYPSFITFDAPTADRTCPRRVRSNTPLQALTTLNDEVFVEAAQALARRVMTEAGVERNASGRIARAFRLCVAREPSATELERMLAFYQSNMDRFTRGEGAPERIALREPETGVGDLPIRELAALTLVSRAILNLDETITRE